jgi:hypothetical protein
MIFGIEVEEGADTAIDSFNTNLKEKPVAQWLFRGKILKIDSKTRLVDIEYLLPMPTIFLLIGLIIGVIFSIWWMAYITGSLILAILVLQSKFFFYLALKVGARKKGYKGKIKLLGNVDTYRRLIKVKLGGNNDEKKHF